MSETFGLNLSKEMFVHTIFFLSLPSTPGEDQGKDWLAFVVKNKDGWSAQARFRYYHERDAFGDKDKKNWYRFDGIQSAENAERAVQTFRRIAQEMQEATKEWYPDFECLFTELSIMGDGEKAADMLAKQSWAQMKYTNHDGKVPQA